MARTRLRSTRSSSPENSAGIARPLLGRGVDHPLRRRGHEVLRARRTRASAARRRAGTRRSRRAAGRSRRRWAARPACRRRPAVLQLTVASSESVSSRQRARPSIEAPRSSTPSSAAVASQSRTTCRGVSLSPAAASVARQAVEAVGVLPVQGAEEPAPVAPAEHLHQRVRRAVVGQDLVGALVPPQRQPVLRPGVTRVRVDRRADAVVAEEGLDVAVEAPVGDRRAAGRRSP